MAIRNINNTNLSFYVHPRASYIKSDARFAFYAQFKAKGHPPCPCCLSAPRPVAAL